MVAFAVGGILGDTFFHLLPEIFVGEDAADHVRFNLVEPNKNLLLGVAILVGFMTFVIMDKTIRIATGASTHDHVSEQLHEKEESDTEASDEVKIASGTEPPSSNLRNRKSPTENPASSHEVTSPPQEHHSPSTSAQLGGYLNLIADFTHNITDGLALSSSFYASTTIGATTTVAVFFHEIPHEVGDFALLVQSGFSKREAMGAQFVTAIGALLGTLIGIGIQEFGGNNAYLAVDGASQNAPGLLGTSLMIGDLLLPFTAGTFLYVATVSVIPDLLDIGNNRHREIGKSAAQFLALSTGAGLMLL